MKWWSQSLDGKCTCGAQSTATDDTIETYTTSGGVVTLQTIKKRGGYTLIPALSLAARFFSPH